jgi:hypothetical protein
MVGQVVFCRLNDDRAVAESYRTYWLCLVMLLTRLSLWLISLSTGDSRYVLYFPASGCVCCLGMRKLKRLMVYRSRSTVGRRGICVRGNPACCWWADRWYEYPRNFCWAWAGKNKVCGYWVINEYGNFAPGRSVSLVDPVVPVPAYLAGDLARWKTSQPSYDDTRVCGLLTLVMSGMLW